MLTAAAISTGPAGANLEAAHAAAGEAVIRAAEGGADLIVLPELFALPYVACDDPARWRHLAEAMDGPTVQWSSRLARDIGVAMIFGGAIDIGDSLSANAALAAMPDGTVRILAEKVNLPPRDGAAYGEADHFRAGTIPPAIARIGSALVGAIVCYDRRYPECWRRLAAERADLVAVLVAGPAPADPPGIYEAELRTHARANAVFVVAAARTGVETVTGRQVRHDGTTMTVDSGGSVCDAADQTPGSIAWLRISDDALEAARAGRGTRTEGMSRYHRVEAGERHE
jgi:predicted amidohydrolase